MRARSKKCTARSKNVQMTANQTSKFMHNHKSKIEVNEWEMREIERRRKGERERNLHKYWNAHFWMNDKRRHLFRNLGVNSNMMLPKFRIDWCKSFLSRAQIIIYAKWIWMCEWTQLTKIPIEYLIVMLLSKCECQSFDVDYLLKTRMKSHLNEAIKIFIDISIFD